MSRATSVLRLRALTGLAALSFATSALSGAALLDVQDGAGNPVTNASAWLVGRPDRAVAGDEFGTVELELEDGGASLCLSAPGRRTVRVDLAADEWSRSVTLPAGGSVVGRAVDETGTPVAGARVTTRPGATSSAGCEPVATSAEDGSFRVEGLGSGRVSLTVEADGHLPARAERLRVGGRRSAELLLRRAVIVTGRVQGPGGDPLEGVEVELGEDWDGLPVEPKLGRGERKALDELRVETDAEGRFRIESLPRRTSWPLTFRHDTVAPALIQLDGERAQAEISVKLQRGATLALRAVDAGGAVWPEPRATLRWQDSNVGELLDMPLTGDRSGALVADRLPTGRVVLELSAPGAQPVVRRNIELRDDKTKQLGDVVLEPGATLRGVVESTRGDRLAGAKVVAKTHVGARTTSFEAETDSDGAFAIEGLDPSARVSLEAKADGHLTDHERGLPASSSDVTLSLEPAGGLRLRVTQSETGEPVDDVTLSFKTADGRRFRTASPREDEEDEPAPGEHVFDELPVGALTLRVAAEGLAPRMLEAVEILAGEIATRDVQLEPGWELAGRVLDEKRGAVAGAEVKAELPGGATQSARSGVDGRFDLSGLIERVSLVVEHPDFMPGRREALDSSSAGSEVEVVLERGGAIEGLVTGPDGRPQLGAQVRVAQTGRSAVSGADGWYRIGGVAPGQLRLMKTDAVGSYRGLQEVLVEPSAGEVLRQDFGDGNRVVGTVTLAGEPVEGASVSLLPLAPVGDDELSSMLGRHAVTDAEGGYVLPDMKPGPAVLHVGWRERRFGREVEIPDVPEHRLDIPMPDLRVSGRVVRGDDGSPVAHATVNARRVNPDDPNANRASSSRSMGGGDDPNVFFSTRPSTQGSSAADGSFEVLIPEEGTWRLSAWWWRDGDQLQTKEPVELELRASRTGVLLEVFGDDEESGDLEVAVVDAETGTPIQQGQYMVRTHVEPNARGGNTMIGSFGGGLATQEGLTAGEPTHCVAWADGRAPARQDNVEILGGETTRVELRLARGGDLRLLVPPDSGIESSHFAGLSGFELLNEEGENVLVPFGAAIGNRAAEEETGVWLLKQLPVGRYVVKLGSGETSTVDVETGRTAEADLR